MYKTIWMIKDIENNTTTELTLYHFGKAPKFPTLYMEKGKAYEIEMLWNLKLVHTPKLFFECLTRAYIVK